MSRNKKDIQERLVSMGFEPDDIRRAFKIYEKNYGDFYMVHVITPIIDRLQKKKKKKAKKNKTVNKEKEKDNNNNIKKKCKSKKSKKKKHKSIYEQYKLKTFKSKQCKSSNKQKYSNISENPSNSNSCNMNKRISTNNACYSKSIASNNNNILIGDLSYLDRIMSDIQATKTSNFNQQKHNKFHYERGKPLNSSYSRSKMDVNINRSINKSSPSRANISTNNIEKQVPSLKKKDCITSSATNNAPIHSQLINFKSIDLNISNTKKDNDESKEESDHDTESSDDSDDDIPIRQRIKLPPPSHCTPVSTSQSLQQSAPTSQTNNYRIQHGQYPPNYAPSTQINLARQQQIEHHLSVIEGLLERTDTISITTIPEKRKANDNNNDNVEPPHKKRRFNQQNQSVYGDMIDINGEKEEEDDDEDKCVICYDGIKEYLCVPCGHLVFCENCKDATKKCPVCRADNCTIIKLFK